MIRYLYIVEDDTTGNRTAQQWSLVSADGRYMLEAELIQASPRRIAQR